MEGWITRLKRRAVNAPPPEESPGLANDTDYLCLVMELVWAARAGKGSRKRERETLACEQRLTDWIEGYVRGRIQSARNYKETSASRLGLFVSYL